ncbi:MAG: Fic family protein [Georgfuchsia sp.]
MYIWQQPQWPNWQIDMGTLATPLASVRHGQGRLLGRMEAMGFKLRDEAWLQTLTQDVIKTSEIEGEHLDKDLVRSSIARRLGIDIGALAPADRNVEGIVDVMLDATQRYAQPLTRDRLFGWHGALFPTGRSGLHAISVAAWRTDENGPMQVISGPYGKEKVHYEAPAAASIDVEMQRFLDWFKREDKSIDPVIKAALAHLWFVTIHPFDDGNGRLARTIGDMALARSELTPQRFYSLSAQIQLERASYYDILEETQRGTLDVTGWLAWFLACLERAIAGAEQTLESVLIKARFWERYAGSGMNERQIKLLNRLLDGFEGKMTTSKWAKIAKCSQDTAYRDILGLIELRALVKAGGGGRSTGYELVPRHGTT